MRMAFASVAEQTIAILGVIIAIAMTTRTRHWPQLHTFLIIALLVFGAASATMGPAADPLSSRLATVDQVSRLNPWSPIPRRRNPGERGIPSRCFGRSGRGAHAC